MQTDTQRKGVVIAGSTSSMARAVASEFARNGWRVVLAARDQDENEAIAMDLRIRHMADTHCVSLDAENFSDHGHFYDQCRAILGDAIECLVVCFGFMDEQPKAQQDFDIARRTIDVNLTAVVSIVERFAADFEQRKRGRIAVISSVAGDRGRQSNYLYGASKAGLSTYLQGLRNRLHAAGVSVTTIKPGFVDTKMSWGLTPFAAGPEEVGLGIYRAVDKRRDVVYLPFFWRYIMMIIRLIPEFQFKRMKL